MSYSTLMVAGQDGDFIHDQEYRNAWGITAMVWGSLIHRYEQPMHPDENPALAFGKMRNPFEEWKLLCQMAPRLPLRPWENIVLNFTYDRAICTGNRLLELAQALQTFEEAHAKPGNVCHLKSIATRLIELHAQEPPPRAVALYPTSVAENLWVVHEQTADEEDGDCRPYNLGRDTGHFDIFGEQQ